MTTALALDCPDCTRIVHLVVALRIDLLCPTCGALVVWRPEWRREDRARCMAAVVPRRKPVDPAIAAEALEHALRRLLSDLAEISRGRLHADPGSCILGHLAGESFAPEHDQLPCSSPDSWTVDDSLALGHASLTTDRTDAPDHDWTRWRRLEAKLGAIGGIRRRVLDWLLAHATAASTAQSLTRPLAWSLARAVRRVRWIERGWYPPTTERKAPSKGDKAKPRVRGLVIPGRIGQALLRGALAAWWGK